jgi:hypothetical protein
VNFGKVSFLASAGFSFFYCSPVFNFASFSLDAASLLFAPSTIAISAVVVSLSLMKMDCSRLLDSLPEFLLPSRAYPFFKEEDGKNLYLDLNSCVKAIEKLPYVRSTYMTRSPTSIAEVIPSSVDSFPSTFFATGKEEN